MAGLETPEFQFKDANEYLVCDEKIKAKKSNDKILKHNNLL